MLDPYFTFVCFLSAGAYCTVLVNPQQNVFYCRLHACKNECRAMLLAARACHVTFIVYIPTVEKRCYCCC